MKIKKCAFLMEKVIKNVKRHTQTKNHSNNQDEREYNKR